VIDLAKIKKWFGSRKLKRERKPFIKIRIEMPEGFEELRAQFLNLEEDERFLEEVENLVKKRLTYERQGIKPPS
jgi:hypothetical protein